MLRRQLLQRAASLLAVVPAAHPFLQKVPSTKGISHAFHGIVGAWFVNAVGAPFQPHVMEFHADGTLEIDNPESGDPHTSDSVGMGPWAFSGDKKVIGAFEEVNADRDTHQYVSRLRVEFTITLSDDGDTFTGPATANYFNPDGSPQQGPFPATLNGTRIKLPQ